MDDESVRLAEKLGQVLLRLGLTLACAESCTGGLLAGTLTAVPGSSAWFRGGVVAYHDELKISLLGVPAEFFRSHGAVSEPVVLAMARGARTRLRADLALSVSGIAGPGGGTPDKPVGTVWLACSDQHGEHARRFLFPGDRQAVRARILREALDGLLARVQEALRLL